MDSTSSDVAMYTPRVPNKRAPARIAAASRPSLFWTPVWLLLGVAVVAALLPAGALRSLDLVGYAVCHRITERSFIVGGTQLPVCARDTGMFLGVLLGTAGFAVLPNRRATGFPGMPQLAALAAFFLAWGFDGVNSYLKLIVGSPLLYEPQNWLRLTTGALMGVSLSAVVVPLFNQAVWRPELASSARAVATWADVGRLALTAAGVIAVVLWQPPFLYGSLAALSTLGVLMLLGMVNGLLLLIVMRRAQTVERWSQLAFPLVAGAMLALSEVVGIAMLRAALTQSLGLPF